MREHFDKLMLLGLTILMFAVLLDLVKYHADSTVIPWLEKSLDIVLGSLLTLITGQAFRASQQPPPPKVGTTP